MNEFSQIGIYGTFAILVIREVLNFLNRKKNGEAGERSVEFWQAQFRAIVEGEVKDALRSASYEMRDLKNEVIQNQALLQKHTELLNQICNRLESRRIPR